MSVNKVVISDETKLDLTADTVDAAHLAKGYTAHNKKGEAITGTMESGSSGSGAWIEGDWTYWTGSPITTSNIAYRTSFQPKAKLHGFAQFPCGVFCNAGVIGGTYNTSTRKVTLTYTQKNASMGVEVDCSDCPDMIWLPAWSIYNCNITKFVAPPIPANAAPNLVGLDGYAITVPYTDTVADRPNRVFDFRLCGQVPSMTQAQALGTVKNNNADSFPPEGLYANGYINTITIVVPDSLYDEWITKTNWTLYASAIVKASEYTEETI